MGNLIEILSTRTYSGWILWNLFLAFIPLGLSFWLFRSRQRRRFWWWLGLVTFIAFLPNAPYLLTDVIHLIRAIRNVPSVWVITLVVIPLHVSAILAGLLAYVQSVINQGIYLQCQGLGRYVLGSELLTHILAAIGIYLGRFRRFNSWDLVTDPSNVLLTTADDLTSRWPLLVIVISFCVLTVLYWTVKQVLLGLQLRLKSRQV